MYLIVVSSEAGVILLFTRTILQFFVMLVNCHLIAVNYNFQDEKKIASIVFFV